MKALIVIGQDLLGSHVCLAGVLVIYGGNGVRVFLFYLPTGSVRRLKKDIRNCQFAQ